jgi:hypothetical protein
MLDALLGITCRHGKNTEEETISFWELLKNEKTILRSPPEDAPHLSFSRLPSHTHIHTCLNHMEGKWDPCN